MRLIDADALIRDIEHYNLSDGKFQHWVEIQPTIEPFPQWIPCSERLPEHGGYFIVTSIINEDAVRVGTQWYSSKYGWVSKEQTLAWMPLPEPYKENNDQ